MIIIITNKIIKIDNEAISTPLIVRSNEEGWIPTLDLWQTTIDDEISYIDCPQNFRPKIKNYSTNKINSEIGYYDNDNLVVNWKTLINSDEAQYINQIYNGKMRATNWQKRYCTYFSTSSSMPWLHTVLTDNVKPDFVVHHINGVSIDNHLKNLHILPKKEHDGINHPLMEQRKEMFANPAKYWQKRKDLAIDQFITELSLIIIDDAKSDFIAKFASKNLVLSKEILKAARYYINLSQIKSDISENRRSNSHLSKDYLDAYEIEKFLNINTIKNNENQLRLF